MNPYLRIFITLSVAKIVAFTDLLCCKYFIYVKHTPPEYHKLPLSFTFGYFLRGQRNATGGDRRVIII